MLFLLDRTSNPLTLYTHTHTHRERELEIDRDRDTQKLERKRGQIKRLDEEKERQKE